MKIQWVAANLIRRYIILMRHPVHDYSTPGGYFVTFATANRIPLLGRIEDNQCHVSQAGKLALSVWRKLPQYYPALVLDCIQMMPDHVHCIFLIVDKCFTEGDQIVSLPQVMQAFKAAATREIRKAGLTRSAMIWQKGYYDRVIRSEQELEKFRNYLLNNPLAYSLKHQARGELTMRSRE